MLELEPVLLLALKDADILFQFVGILSYSLTILLGHTVKKNGACQQCDLDKKRAKVDLLTPTKGRGNILVLQSCSSFQVLPNFGSVLIKVSTNFFIESFVPLIDVANICCFKVQSIALLLRLFVNPSF
mmetsp:Transcript_3137/g.4849  ORF Transcript_3137/g.4849 Transcript_3137/m.4849 type:complete len:128 (+) Transcript_3137:257-640(+)